MVVDWIELVKELERRLEKWKEDEKISKDEFLNNIDKQDSICYNMMIAIQCAIDLGNFIIQSKKFETPATYAEIFEILGRHKILDKKLAEEMQILARTRNVLAHLYWKIDLLRVFRVLKTKRKILEKFLKKVKGVLK